MSAGLKGDGSNLDAHILAAIRAGTRRMEDLAVIVCRHAPAETGWRAVSDRLEAMRMRGLVNYKPRRGWALEVT